MTIKRSLVISLGAALISACNTQGAPASIQSLSASAPSPNAISVSSALNDSNSHPDSSDQAQPSEAAQICGWLKSHLDSSSGFPKTWGKSPNSTIATINSMDCSSGRESISFSFKYDSPRNFLHYDVLLTSKDLTVDAKYYEGRFFKSTQVGFRSESFHAKSSLSENPPSPLFTKMILDADSLRLTVDTLTGSGEISSNTLNSSTEVQSHRFTVSYGFAISLIEMEPRFGGPFGLAELLECWGTSTCESPNLEFRFDHY